MIYLLCFFTLAYGAVLGFVLGRIVNTSLPTALEHLFKALDMIRERRDNRLLKKIGMRKDGEEKGGGRNGPG